MIHINTFGRCYYCDITTKQQCKIYEIDPYLSVDACINCYAKQTFENKTCKKCNKIEKHRVELHTSAISFIGLICSQCHHKEIQAVSDIATLTTDVRRVNFFQ